MSHITAIRNGMTASDEKDLSNIAVAFINTGGGVVATNDYLVQAQGSPNNTVLVNTGRAYVQTVDTTMMYATHLDATQNVTIGANSSGNPRVDSIVLYIDLAVSPDAGATNVAKFFDVQGTPAGSPVAPTNAQILTAIGSSNPYIILANIAVANGFTSISSGNITDARQFTAFNTGQTVPVALYEEFLDQGVAPASPASGKTRFFTIGGALFQKTPSGGVIQVGNSTFFSNGNSGSAPVVDWSKGITQTFTLNSNATFTFTNMVAGAKYTLYCTQDATGSRSITWPGTVRWSNGVTPPPTTSPNQTDIFGFIYTGSLLTGFSSPNYSS